MSRSVITVHPKLFSRQISYKLLVITLTLLVGPRCAILDIIQHSTQSSSRGRASRRSLLILIRHRILQHPHHHGLSTVRASMLRQVITARELLPTLGALEGFVLRVQRAVVPLEMFLATEATRAQRAHKGLAGVVRQRLFASATVDRHGGTGFADFGDLARFIFASVGVGMGVVVAAAVGVDCRGTLHGLALLFFFGVGGSRSRSRSSGSRSDRSRDRRFEREPSVLVDFIRRLTQEPILFRIRNALPLVTQEESILARREIHQVYKFIVRVQFRKAIKSRQGREGILRDGRRRLVVVVVVLLLLLVSDGGLLQSHGGIIQLGLLAQSRQGRQIRTQRRLDGQFAGVAEMRARGFDGQRGCRGRLLRLRHNRSVRVKAGGHGRRRRRQRRTRAVGRQQIRRLAGGERRRVDKDCVG